MAEFRFRMRVRYHECDGQKVVFNARYGEYVDVATIEFARVVFGSVHPHEGGIDWRLVQQTMQWKAPAHFDDILEVCIETSAVGTSSFTLNARVHRPATDTLLAEATTVYVKFDEAKGSKAALDTREKEALQEGAPGVVVDASGLRV